MTEPLLSGDSCSCLAEPCAKLRSKRTPGVVAALDFILGQLGEDCDGPRHLEIRLPQGRDIVAIGISQGSLPRSPPLDNCTRIHA